MESISSATTVGVGTPLPDDLSICSSDTYKICRYVSQGGRGCKMVASSDSPSGLCTFHSRRQAAEMQRLQNPEGEVGISEETASKLLRSTHQLTCAEDVNRFLGNVVREMVRGQVSRRDALAFGYLGQLVLNSISAWNDELDHQAAREVEQENALLRAFRPAIVHKDGRTARGLFGPDNELVLGPDNQPITY